MTAIQGGAPIAARTQSRSASAADWTPTSWRGRPALQMPVYPDATTLAGAKAEHAGVDREYQALARDRDARARQLMDVGINARVSVIRICDICIPA